MPAPQHLKWTEFRQFKGLWTSGEKLLMPTDAAQVMSGCSPQPGGGLRAWFKPQVVATAHGMQVLDGLSHEITGFGTLGYYADNDPLVIVTMHRVPKVDGRYTDQRMMHWPIVASESEAERRWAHVTDGADFDGKPENKGQGIRTGKGVRTVVSVAGTTLGASLGQYFMNALGGFGGGYREGYEVGYGSDHGQGIYEITITPGPAPNVKLQRHSGLAGAEAEDLGPVIAHQNRVVMAAKNGIMFTTPGQYDFPNDIGDGDNWLALSSGAYDRPESHPAWMLSVPPSDLLVANHRGDLYNIQGPLDDPTVRELSRSLISMPHLPKNTAYGPVILLPSTGPVILGFDGSTQELAATIDSAAWFVDDDFGFFGSVDYLNHLLFVPNQHSPENWDLKIRNGLLVYDFRTQSWFTSAHPDLVECPNPRFMFVEGARKDGGVVMFTGDVIDTANLSKAVMVRHPILAANQARAEIYEWVSAPVRSPEGERVEAQQVEIAARSFGRYGTMTVTLSNGKDSVSYIVDLPQGTSAHTIPLVMKGDYIEVGVKSKSNEEGVEAPMLDFVRIGWIPREHPTVRPEGGFRGGFAGGF